MELKFVATTRPEKLNPTVQRRQKLVRRIDQQIGYVRQMSVAGRCTVGFDTGDAAIRWGPLAARSRGRGGHGMHGSGLRRLCACLYHSSSSAGTNWMLPTK